MFSAPGGVARSFTPFENVKDGCEKISSAANLKYILKPIVRSTTKQNCKFLPACPDLTSVVRLLDSQDRCSSKLLNVFTAELDPYYCLTVAMRCVLIDRLHNAYMGYVLFQFDFIRSIDRNS